MVVMAERLVDVAVDVAVVTSLDLSWKKGILWCLESVVEWRWEAEKNNKLYLPLVRLAAAAAKANHSIASPRRLRQGTNISNCYGRKARSFGTVNGWISDSS
jgi:hypothetical protein